MNDREFTAALVAEIGMLRRYASSQSVGGLRLRSYDIDDLVQDTLLRAWASRHRFDGDNIGGWLLQILRNRHRDIRSLADTRTTDRYGYPGLVAAIDDCWCSPPEQEAALTWRDFVCAFGSLKAIHRTAIYLVGVEGLGFRQAAEEQGAPLNTFLGRVARGRAALRAAVA